MDLLPCLPKAVSDHRECRTDTATGCPRCAYLQPLTCCEGCSPGAFMDFAAVDLRVRPKSAPPRSRLKDYKHDGQDKALRSALHEFRKRKTIEKYGAPALYDIGPSLYMTHEVLDRITNCAHFSKIQDGEQLKRETRWMWTAEDIEE